MKSPRSSGKPKKPKLLLIRRISGESMLPAFRPGRIVIAVPYYKTLRPGDVVIIRHEGLEKIKRVARITQGQVYVTGDNQAYSTDSRLFGWLDRSAIIAKIIWPIAARHELA
jgi:phage repressor protein C with HTH and peptisase S24 domain